MDARGTLQWVSWNMQDEQEIHKSTFDWRLEI